MSAKTELRALARRYARGLADAAPRDLGGVSASLEGWKKTVEESADLRSVLSNPRIPRPSRAELAQELFSKLEAPAALMNLVKLLIDENRFSLLDPIRDAFIEEREKREGIQCVVIESPAPLTDQVRERIRSRVAEILRLHVRIEEHVRPGLIGGVNLRIGSQVWYGSVRQRLEQVFR